MYLFELAFQTQHIEGMAPDELLCLLRLPDELICLHLMNYFVCPGCLLQYTQLTRLTVRRSASVISLRTSAMRRGRPASKPCSSACKAQKRTSAAQLVIACIDTRVH